MLYWLILVVIIGSTFFIKKDAKFYLFTAFSILGIGVIFRIIGLIEVSEVLMRISLILWIFGLFKAFRELN